MLVYRIAPRIYASDVIGEGALKHGGRWNPKGKPVLYTAETPSLAMLECLAHYAINGAPSNLVLVAIRIPDNVTIRKPVMSDYPSDWNARPVKPSTMRFGSDWLDAANESVLRVPSVITPEECGWNYLLNPLHPELQGKIVIEKSVEWELDTRIAARLPDA